MYTWKRINKLNSLVAAMYSITLILPTLALWRIPMIISLAMKQLTNLKDMLLTTNLSPPLLTINSILDDAKFKERIMNY